MSWDELRWAEMSWDALRWAEMSWGELRWAEVSWVSRDAPRCAEMRWDELRWAEMSWDELRWAEVSWDELSEPRCAEMRWDELRCAEMRWDELRWAEMRWDALRWAEMHWGELRWAEMRWGELRWAGWAKIFNLQFLRDVSRKMRFWEVADARNRLFCSKKRASENGWGRSAARRVRDGLGFARIILNRPHIGTIGSGFICATLKSCSFEGCLERRVRFQSFNFQFLRDVSYESLVLTTSTFSFWGMSRTKASFSRAQLSVFEGCLVRKPRSHNLNFQFLRDVSHESFVFTSSTFSFWGMSRTKASFSPTSTFRFSFWGMSRTKASFSRAQLSVFEGCLARKLSFHKLNFQFLRDASHESFVFTTSAFSLWVRSRAKTWFSQLQLPELKEVLQLRFHKWKLLFNCAKRLRQWVFADFSRFWSLSYSFFLNFKIVLFGPWRRASVLEQVFWAREELRWSESERELRRAEMRWEELTRGERLRGGEMNWEDLRTTQKSWGLRGEEMRRHEKTWHVLTWAAKSWGRVEKRWDNPRRGEITWGEMTWDELRRPDMRRWWRAEKSCVETSCVEWRNWEAERSWNEKSSDEVRRDEKA